MKLKICSYCYILRQSSKAGFKMKKNKQIMKMNLMKTLHNKEIK